MISILLFFSISSIPVKREVFDTTVLKVLDDTFNVDAFSKVKSAFLFFHTDHLRISDVAYMNYVEAASKHQGEAIFYVVPQPKGSKIAQTYEIKGTPNLIHVRYGHRKGTHLGMFSKDSINRFVTNWTTPKYIDFSTGMDISEKELFVALKQVFPENKFCILLLSDNSTKYGRNSIDIAEDLAYYFSFARLSVKEVANTLNVRYPSLLLFRFEDSQRVAYSGDLKSDLIYEWATENLKANYKKLDLYDLFSPDGVPMKSIIAFYDSSDPDQFDQISPILEKNSKKYSNYLFYHSDYRRTRAIANLFNVTKLPSLVFLSSNYTYLNFALSTDIKNSEQIDAFTKGNLELSRISTPSQLYGYVKQVTEYSFDKIREQGPVYTIFTVSNSVRCKNLKTAAYDAAQTLKRYGTELQWAIWDVNKQEPSFSYNISISIPSLWYFGDKNISKGYLYQGPPNYLAIIEWANGNDPDLFDIDEITSQELGSDFDEI